MSVTRWSERATICIHLAFGDPAASDCFVTVIIALGEFYEASSISVGRRTCSH